MLLKDAVTGANTTEVRRSIYKPDNINYEKKNVFKTFGSWNGVKMTEHFNKNDKHLLLLNGNEAKMLFDGEADWNKKKLQ